MKIVAFVHHYYPFIGGAEITLHKYLDYAAKNGHECHAVCFYNNDGRQFPVDRQFLLNNVHVNQTRMPIDLSIQNYAHNADVVITMLTAAPQVIKNIKSKYPDKKIVNIVCGYQEGICQDYMKRGCESLLTCTNCDHSKKSSFQDMYNKCDLIISNSQYTQVLLKKFYDVDSTIIHPITNDAMISVVKQPTVCFVNPQYHKGHEIFKQIAKTMTSTKFIVIGDTQDSKLDAPNVEYRGNLDEMLCVQTIAESQCVLIPSICEESFSMVAVEAMNHGTIPIVSNRGALPETTGGAGIVIEHINDIDAWVNSIRRVLSSNNFQQEYFQKCINRGSAFNNDTQCELFLNAIVSTKNLANEVKKISIPKSNKPDRIVEPLGGLNKVAFESNKPKVLFMGRFFYPPLGGGEYTLLEYLKYLQTKGYDCIAVCFRKPDNEFFWPPAKYLKWDGIKVLQHNVMSSKSVSELYQRLKPDVVVTQSYDAITFIEEAQRLKIPTVLGTHFYRNICNVPDNYYNMLNRSVASLELLPKENQVFTKSTVNYANSEFTKKVIKRLIGVDVENVINPVISLEHCLSENHEPEFITLINPDYHKGGKLLTILAEIMSDKRFLCVGKAPTIIKQNIEINEKLESLDNVSVIEKTDNISEVYKITKLLLVPSMVDETFSMVTLEAMFNGIPVIGSCAGNLPYIIEDGGIILSDNNPQTWMMAIQSLYDNPQMYANLSMQAFNNAQKYHPDIQCEKFEKLIRGLIV